MSTVERRVLDFFEKNIIWFLYGFITIAALVLRYQFVDWKMSDYNDYLEPWFLELKRGWWSAWSWADNRKLQCIISFFTGIADIYPSGTGNID